MTTFTITSFNARWGLGADDVPFDLAAAVEAFDTDLVSVQEFWHHDEGGPELLRDLSALGYHAVHLPLSPSHIDPLPEITPHPQEADGTWGVVLLSRLPVLTTRVVDLGRLMERWDVAERCAVIAEVEVGGISVSVTALHLSFALPNAVAQLRRLHGYLPAHRPSVVAGDCNLWGPLAGLALAGHRRAVRGRTWPAHRPHSQLDHIWITPGIDVDDSRVLPPAGSDHRPVQATLRLG